MTEEQILDRMSQMIRVGFVNARQPEKMRVKVTLKDTVTSELVTDWLPVLCARACKDMGYDLPDIGDQVLCLFLPYGLEQGFVIGAMYGKQTPPVQSGDKWHRLFEDGTFLEYDRKEHKLTANVKGSIDVQATGACSIKSDGAMTLEAPIIYARGTFVNTDKEGAPGKSVFSGGMTVMDGGINVPDADVVAGSVSLLDHKHTGVQPGAGVSDVPAGGGGSPGTGTQGGNSSGSQNPVDNTQKHLSALEAEVENAGSDIEKLIMCLPNIAAAEAENANIYNKKGWLYLHDMSEKWLSGIGNSNALNNKDVFWVDLDWALAFTRVNVAYRQLISKPYLFSPNARSELSKILKRDNLFSQSELTPFDYTSRPWNSWRADYFQQVQVKGTLAFPPDGLTASMGEFQLRALAKGYTQYDGDNQYAIVIQGVSVFIWDSFNFEGEYDLKFWSCDPPAYSSSSKESFINLHNSDFQNFRNKHGMGNDFLVLSHPQPVDPPVVFSYVTDI